jgi:malonyl CoA-acyl carrier protein transacylase
MPDAESAEQFWQNIVTGRNSITEVDPIDRWDPELYYSEDREVPDKTYSKIGGFVKGFKLNPVQYRIPPNVLTQIDMVQQWALASAREALEDANYTNDDFPTERTAVIVGNSLGGEKSFEVAQRVYFPAVAKALRQTENFKKLSTEEQEQIISELEVEYKQTIPIINEDSMPGELANIVAGRVAATFNLRGKNMTSDAACASSLAAIDVAYKGLLAHEFDAAVVGGSDRSMDPPTYVKFAKIGALSADGSFPFDERANGFVMGEGAGMMVVKRLSDALAAGDKIYALITGVGSSSDGKGKGITAPNPIGQELAVKRALESAGVSGKDLQLVEAHGTSTSVGDFVEVSTIEKVFKDEGVAPGGIRLGSIKSQIGHLKSAAGAAGILKTVLALHHKVFPPSINFVTPNPKIDWDSSPFVVNTHPIEWPKPDHTTRRAGVSSFGFGGTNFHVILEEYDPNQDYSSAEEVYGAFVPEEGPSYEEYIERNAPFSNEPLLLSAATKEELLEELESLTERIPETNYFEDMASPSVVEITNYLPFIPSDPFRLGISADDMNNLSQTISMAKGAIEDEKRRSLAQNRGVFYSDGLPEGKVSFVFPGQGSQYADMMVDLAQKYRVVQETFDEADEILKDMLDNPLSDYIFSRGQDSKEVEQGLRQTQITQPAMLTADIALYRLLVEFGVTPDMVAGHSLGEYAALVASGVLSFADALKAVAIRGKAMSEVDAEDKGTMASISGSLEEVEAVLQEVEGYAIAANKNSLSTTVISGSTPGVEEAVAKFQEKGMNAIPLSVSAAFHTTIVAPAAEPLSVFLDTVKFNTPSIPITSNVSGEFFPTDPEEIRELMKQQVGAAVEWTKQVQAMHREGSAIFYEVGPKRALSSFVADILKDESILAVICNHPKKGGIRTLNDAIAASAALGKEITRVGPQDEMFHPLFRQPEIKTEKLLFPTAASLEAPIAEVQPQQQSSQLKYDQVETIVDQIGNYLQSDAGMSRKLGMNFDKIVITGAGVGLPGIHKEVFAADNVDRILRGDNLIELLPREKLEAQLEKNIRRLIKKSTGEAEFYSPKNYDDVISLAGQAGKFDIVEEFAISKEIASTYDLATSLAIASGLEALKDAGIPLVREYKKTSAGTYLPGDYVLPEELQADTGIIFASAFPGFDSFAKEITSFKEYQLKERNRNQLTELYGEISRRVQGDSRDFLLEKLERELNELDKEVGEFHFNRKILLEVLSFGHAQFAQLIKAKGPNTQVNAACASTTQALGVATDWIRTGRAKRVIVISADNITSDNLFEWLGSGFLASGAASVKDKVEEAALPFDRRRGGMIIGMGAAGFMVEPQAEAQRRGVTPIVELLGTHYGNSAFHGTRLDTMHVSAELQDFISSVERVHGISRETLANSMMFMSHETYTPRRGGSAAAEIRSLRETFGSLANRIHVANTKGFTGHPMGAGIEDVIAIKAVEKGKIPPIANFKEPDPDLGDLKLSTGGNIQVEYALRLAAGFGSQITFALYKRMGSGNRFGSAYESWLQSLGGSLSDLYHEGKTLRLRDGGAPGEIASRTAVAAPVRKSVAPKTTPVQSKPSPLRSSVSVDRADIITRIQKVMADMTGYEPSMLDPSLDIEADLGIDTVKMAESIGELNSEFGVETDETMNLAEINTIEKVADYFVDRLAGSAPITPASSSSTPSSDVNRAEIVEKIQGIMADMSGYEPSMLDPSLDIEADLGIDTVKMAESIGELNSAFGVETDETMNLAEINTIDKVADYYVEKLSGVQASTPAVKPQTGDDLFQEIVEVISTLTGYPGVMIADASVNLVDDLGVDADTMSQIASELSKKFGVSSDAFASVITIQDIINSISGNVSASAPGESKPAAKKQAATPTFGQVEVADNVRELVTSILSEISGYPAMMVEDTLHLVNDLGIDDSTKQSIVDRVAKETGVNATELEKAQFVGDFYRVVNGEMLEDVEPEKVDKPEPVKPSEPSVSDVAPGDMLAEITAIIAEKTGYPSDMLDPSLDLESELGIDTVKQAEIFGIARQKYGIPPIEGMQIAEYNTITKITNLIAQSVGSGDPAVVEDTAVEIEDKVPEATTFRYVLRENHKDLVSEFDGPATIFGRSSMAGYLANLLDVNQTKILSKIESPEPVFIITDPIDKLVPDIYEFFEFLKEHASIFTTLALVVKSKNDSTIHSLTPLQGAIAGMFKALAMEFPNIRAKIILAEKDTQVKAEILNPGVEVVYRGDKRYEVALAEADLPERDYTLPEDAILLASGGAQGITFELVKSISTSSSTLVLLGRTEIRDDAEEIAQLSPKELEARKFQLMKQLQDAGEKVTPVVLEKEFSKIVKSANVYKSLIELRSMDCKVIYMSVDVTNADDVSSVFDEIRTKIDHQEITHFIHGAGIEISRATKSKKTEEFKLVYDVKVSGFENIMTELRQDRLELVVGFTSVAGRFGNATQVDYSAANEYLAKRCAELSSDGLRAFVIDWSAWAEIGMATRGSTMQVLESQGVTPIPVDQGIQRFHSELAAGDEVEVVISGHLGNLASQVSWFEPDFFRGVMMDQFSGSDLRSHRMLSLNRDRYLDDHRIDGKAVLPGVMGLETMSEVSRAINDASVAAIYNIEFASPVKLPRDNDLEIITMAERVGDHLQLSLKSKFLGPDGNQLGDLRNHFNAKMVTGKRIPSFPVMRSNKVGEVAQKSLLDQSQIYDVFFHGPSYQVLHSLNEMYDDAVIARYNLPEKSMFEDEVDLEINPLIIEAAFQAAGLHLLYVKKQMGLPASVQAIHFFESEKQPVLVRAYFVSETETHSTYNVELIDEDGGCVALLHNYEMIHTGYTDTEDVSLEDETDLVMIRPMSGVLNRDLVVVNTDCLEDVSEEFIDRFLKLQEKTRFSGIQAKKKREEWLAGRIAAKLAVGSRFTILPSQVEIEKDENRSPFAIVSGEKIHVSITHSYGVALAITGDFTVDLEKIESRAPSFINEAFSEDQITKYDLMNIDDTSLTVFWTMKEAHLKRMRIGLKTSLHGVDFDVTDDFIGIVTSPQGQSSVRSIVSGQWALTIAMKVSDQ